MRCPECGHGIDFHGVTSAGVQTVSCVGGERGHPCLCERLPSEVVAARMAPIRALCSASAPALIANGRAFIRQDALIAALDDTEGP